ncbi:alpha/beta fold hydrolase [bacterium]|nr:alpha/beta fold hydrolase [bacterium]
MPKAAVNDIEIYYEVTGAGDPVMLLVGLPGVGKGWGPQTDLFARDFLTIVPDQRGAGQSSRPEGGYTIEQHASDMAETLRTIGCGPAHLVGSSTGGAIGQIMASDHPDVVRSLTIMGSWAVPDDFFRHQFASRKQILLETDLRTYVEASVLFLFSPQYFRDHYAEVRQYCDIGASKASDPVIMAKRIDMIVASDQTERLAAIDRPVLVVVGDHDSCTPPYFSEDLARRIPGAEYSVLAGGHLVYWEDPGAFHALVSEFLQRH